MRSQRRSISEDHIEWTCPKCGSLFGLIDKKTRSTISIKARDKYYWITTLTGETTVQTVCRNCQTAHHITSKS